MCCLWIRYYSPASHSYLFPTLIILLEDIGGKTPAVRPGKKWESEQSIRFDDILYWNSYQLIDQGIFFSQCFSFQTSFSVAPQLKDAWVLLDLCWPAMTKMQLLWISSAGSVCQSFFDKYLSFYINILPSQIRLLWQENTAVLGCQWAPRALPFWDSFLKSDW